MCDDDWYNDETSEPEESWRDYMDIGEVTGNGPEDDNYDPDFD